MVLCVASTETSTYLLLAIVKGATEYLNAGVTAKEKGEEKGKRTWGRVRGRPISAMERGEETDKISVTLVEDVQG